jgi:hypothetical protein
MDGPGWLLHIAILRPLHGLRCRPVDSVPSCMHIRAAATCIADRVCMCMCVCLHACTGAGAAESHDEIAPPRLDHSYTRISNLQISHSGYNSRAHAPLVSHFRAGVGHAVWQCTEPAVKTAGTRIVKRQRPGDSEPRTAGQLESGTSPGLTLQRCTVLARYLHGTCSYLHLHVAVLADTRREVPWPASMQVQLRASAEFCK